MNRCSPRLLGVILLGVLAISSVARAQAVAPTTTPPTSTVPRSVPFNGQVATPQGDARTGNVMLTFSLYPDQQDGTPIWTEQQLVALDNDGRYAVILGSTSADGLPADAFAAGTPRWLGVQVEGESEQPRFMLLSVPYALKAGDADTVGGKPVTEFVTSSHLADSVKSAIKDSKTDPSAPFVTPNALVKYQNSGGALTESSAVDVGGRLGVQVAAPTGELDIAGFGSSTTVTLRNGGSAADVVKLVGADGSLRIGSATNANLINLIGPNVGIGTTAPNAPLHVSGASATSTTFTLENVSGQAPRQLYLSTYGSAGAGAYWPGLDSANTSSLFGPNLFVLRATNGLVFSGTSAAEHMRIAASGRVGIGTTIPGAKLHVNAFPASIAIYADGDVGVWGFSGSSVGTGRGVEGTTFSAQGMGVKGVANAGGIGVYGETANGGTAVKGAAFGNSGGAAVEAVHGATSGFGDGLRATTSSLDAVGIWARNLAGGGTAGRFDGNVAVYGTLTKSSGSFKIDHPLDPENRYLYHSFVESPDMMNIYNGIVTTDANGDADVMLPEWFEALNSDFRYQLTCIGAFAQAIIAREVTGNRFTIKTSAGNVKVSWQVTGIRQDAWARQHRVPVEEAKPAAERGTYLHPEVFNQPTEKSVESARQNEIASQLRTMSERAQPAPAGAAPTRPPER